METTTKTFWKRDVFFYCFTLRHASVHAPNTRCVVPQKSWVCEVNHGSVPRKPALVVDHLGFEIKIVRCEFLLYFFLYNLCISSVVRIVNFFYVHLFVFHLQTEDAPFEPCNFEDEDHNTLSCGKG